MQVVKISTHTLTWSVTRKANLRLSQLKKFQLTRSRGAWHRPVLNVPDNYGFQLTRSRGAWLFKICEMLNPSRFQLTRSRGAWRLNSCNVATILNFNSHAHVERDDVLVKGLPRPYGFQLTRSRGAWQKSCLKIYRICLFQLTRSRGAWQLLNVR